MEIWSPVVGFEGCYEVSSHGRVRSIDRRDRAGRLRSGRVLVQRPDKDGYFYCRLTVDTKIHYCRVHRMVLRAFKGSRPKGMEACHNNGNVGDNRAENLRWDTHKANMFDRQTHGTAARGEKNGSARLCAMKVRKIRELRAAGSTQRQIAKAVGAGRTTVRQVLSGQIWNHVN